MTKASIIQSRKGGSIPHRFPLLPKTLPMVVTLTLSYVPRGVLPSLSNWTLNRIIFDDNRLLGLRVGAYGGIEGWYP